MSPYTSSPAVDRNAVSRKTFSPRGRLSGGWLAAAALTVFMLAAVPLVAQTAHYGAVVTLGSGFSTPTGVAVDASGNVFVADNGNSAVKEILAVNGNIPVSPTINTLGSGFANPFTVAVDGNGNVFLTDYGHHEVKEIEAVNGSIPPSPTIRILGSGFGFLFGSAVDGHGDLFVTDYGKNEVKELVAVDGVVPVAPKILSLGSGFNIPAGVAVDINGNVFIGDQNNNAAKEILAASGYSSTITLATGFSTPDGVAIDGNGNLFVANDGGNSVEEILAVNGVIPASPTILTLGSGFVQPFDVAVDKSGNVYVADRGNNAVKEIQRAGLNFGSVNVRSAAPSPLTFYFTFDTGGTLGSTAVLTQGVAGLDFTDAGGGTCTASTAYSAGQVCTVNVSFLPTAPGPRYGAVELLSSTGTLLATGYVQGNGVGPQVTFAATASGVSLPDMSATVGSGFDEPGGAAVDASGNVFIADTANNAVKEATAASGWATVKTLGAGFSWPSSVAVDGGGNVYVADTFNDAVKEIVAAGGYTTVLNLGSGFSNPFGVALDGSGNVFVADYANNAVKEIVAVNGSIPASPTIRTLASDLEGPDGVAVDGSGNVFVANYNNNTVQEIVAVNGSIPASPTINTIGSGFSGPSNISVDGIGNVFVADTNNSLVKEIVAAGGYTLVEILGSGFDSPEAAAVDKNGNVVVADATTNAVEYLNFADPPSLAFAATQVGATSSDSPQTVTASNDGNALLIFNFLSVAANFTREAGSGTPPDCEATSTVAEGESCELAISFTPAASGTIDGLVVLKDNSLNAAGPNYVSQSIQLSGTGLQIPQTINFTQPVSPVYYPASPITLSATGGASGNPVTFSIQSGPGSLSGTNNSVLTVTGVGIIVIAANQAGNTNYSAAPQVTRSISVPTGTLAVLTSPTPGSTLTGSSATFNWSAGTGVTKYEFRLGTTGPGSANLYNAAEASTTALTSGLVSNIPTTSATIYARLYSYINGAWQYNDYTYKEFGTPVPAALTAPAPGSTLTGSSATFTWSAGQEVTLYEFRLGTTGPGSTNLYNSAEATTTALTSGLISNIPTTGAKLYARLYSRINGAWQYTDYTYTEF